MGFIIRRQKYSGFYLFTKSFYTQEKRQRMAINMRKVEVKIFADSQTRGNPQVTSYIPNLPNNEQIRK